MSESRRGRPRQYDRNTALDNAVAAFWARGYSATTLDDLVAAMGMNRPSIYSAFGDKEAVYRHALDHFIAQMRATVSERVLAEPDLAKALGNLYAGALDVYFGHEPALGCFVFCTAPAEAVHLPEVRAIVAALIDELDDLLAQKFLEAHGSGRESAGRDARLSAKLAQAVLHSLALRARAGESRSALNRLARAAADMLASAAG
jgi:TetR/AcrR family transcriptional regulator, copper-responsive repressor